MPPVFLAFVVDRVVRTIQRHVLGMSEARSPWAVLADAAGASPGSGSCRCCTCCGSWSTGAARARASSRRSSSRPRCRRPPPRKPGRRVQRPEAGTSTAGSAGASAAAGPAKTARLLALVKERHGDLAAIPLTRSRRSPRRSLPRSASIRPPPAPRFSGPSAPPCPPERVIPSEQVRRSCSAGPAGPALALAFARWAFLPARHVPRFRVRTMRLRVRLRLHPGRGFANLASCGGAGAASPPTASRAAPGRR